MTEKAAEHDDDDGAGDVTGDAASATVDERTDPGTVDAAAENGAVNGGGGEAPVVDPVPGDESEVEADVGPSVEGDAGTNAEIDALSEGRPEDMSAPSPEDMGDPVPLSGSARGPEDADTPASAPLPDSASEPEPVSESEPVAEAEPGPEPEPVAEPVAEAEPGPEPEPVAEPVTGPRARAGGGDAGPATVELPRSDDLAPRAEPPVVGVEHEPRVVSGDVDSDDLAFGDYDLDEASAGDRPLSMIRMVGEDEAGDEPAEPAGVHPLEQDEPTSPIRVTDDRYATHPGETRRATPQRIEPVAPPLPYHGDEPEGEVEDVEGARVEEEPRVWPGTTDIGLLLFRIGIGAVLLVHGLRAFGLFGGGLDGLETLLSQVGFAEPPVLAVIYAVISLLAGVMVLLGLFTPVGATAAVTVSLLWLATVSMRSVVEAGGVAFFVESGMGVEFPMILGVASAGILFTGPGRIAADTGRRWSTRSPWVAILGVVVAICVAILTWALLNSHRFPWG